MCTKPYPGNTTITLAPMAPILPSPPMWDSFQKGEILTGRPFLHGHRIQELGFGHTGGSDLSRSIHVHEIRPTPVAQQCRLLPEPGVVPFFFLI